MVLLSIWLWIWYFKRVIKPKFLECPFARCSPNHYGPVAFWTDQCSLQSTGPYGPVLISASFIHWGSVVASLQEHGFRRNGPWSLVHWLSSPRPCVSSSVHWPWLALPKPQAANLCMRKYEYKGSVLRSTDIAGSDNDCRFFVGNENIRETWAGI